MSSNTVNEVFSVSLEGAFNSPEYMCNSCRARSKRNSDLRRKISI